MTKNSELLPCPFCGGNEIKHLSCYDYFMSRDSGSDANIFRCSDCRASTGEYRTKRTAQINWNRRTK